MTEASCRYVHVPAVSTRAGWSGEPSAHGSTTSLIRAGSVFNTSGTPRFSLIMLVIFVAMVERYLRALLTVFAGWDQGRLPQPQKLKFQPFLTSNIPASCYRRI